MECIQGGCDRTPPAQAESTGVLRPAQCHHMLFIQAEQERVEHPNPRLRFIFGANGGLGTARPTGKIRGRERCPACVAVATSAWRRPDRAVWADPIHRELSIHCSSGTERGGLRFVEEINRFEKLPVDLGNTKARKSTAQDFTPPVSVSEIISVTTIIK